MNDTKINAKTTTEIFLDEKAFLAKYNCVREKIVWKLKCPDLSHEQFEMRINHAFFL